MKNLIAYTAPIPIAEANFMPSVIEQNRKKFNSMTFKGDLTLAQK